jgi:hypothetical protein
MYILTIDLLLPTLTNDRLALSDERRTHMGKTVIV